MLMSYPQPIICISLDEPAVLARLDAFYERSARSREDVIQGLLWALVVKGCRDKPAINKRRVLRVLQQLAPEAVRRSQMVELLKGVLSRSSVYRALEALVSSGEVEKRTVKPPSGQPYAVYRELFKT